MKGCDIDARMDFSLFTCSTCLSRMTSEMVMIFRAKNCLVGISRARTTLPNVPVPVGKREERRERGREKVESEGERGGWDRERGGEKEKERERERERERGVCESERK